MTRHGPSHRERAHEAAATLWHTYRDRLAEMSNPSPLAMADEEFAPYRAEIWVFPISFSKEVR